jgi:nitrate/TMAO reductase-like tetraheme cytochrome c subunit
VTENAKPRSRWKKRLVVLSVILGFLLVLLIVSVQVTSSSKFCSACHYMKPFYKSWQESSHRHIECSTCHYPPGLRSKIRAKFEGLVMVGRYWTKLYLKSRPWAEISDQSCLKPGCHDKRLLEGKVRFNKVVFDHTVHLTDLKRGKKLRCTSCHSQIVQGKHITVTPSTCFICHFKESPASPRASACTNCHQKDVLTSAKTARFDHTSVFQNGFACAKCHTHTIVGDGAVPRENCYKCHFETARLQQYGNTDLMHKTHITDHSIECSLCHLEIQHKIVKDIAAIADCRACHTGTHDAQIILFTGQGGKGIAKPTPNVMFDKGLSCKACHIFHKQSTDGRLKAETFTAREKSCESCHGAGFARILKEWEGSTAGKLGSLKAIYAKAQEEVRLSRAGPAEKDKALAMLGDASLNMDIVDKGKSVHNITYSQELLAVSFMRITQALKIAGSSYQPEGAAFRTGRVPAACAGCHTGVEDVSVPAFGLVFSHGIHLGRNMACQACHSNVRKHGELTATKASCASCHHRDAQASCDRCHALQQAFYQGGAAAGLQIPGDIMAQGGVDCKDCHLDQAKAVVRPDGAKCTACHDQTYAASFSKRQKETKDSIARLTSLIAARKSRNPSAEEKAALDSAEQILGALNLEGSSGVHNPAFIQGTLANLEKKLQSFKKGLEHE